MFLKLIITKNVIILESISTKNMPSLKITILSSFLRTLLVTNLSETNFDIGRKVSTTSSSISSAVYLSKQNFNVKGSLKTASGTESNTKRQVSKAL